MVIRKGLNLILRLLRIIYNFIKSHPFNLQNIFLLKRTIQSYCVCIQNLLRKIYHVKLAAKVLSRRFLLSVSPLPITNIETNWTVHYFRKSRWIEAVIKDVVTPYFWNCFALRVRHSNFLLLITHNHKLSFDFRHKSETYRTLFISLLQFKYKQYSIIMGIDI